MKMMTKATKRHDWTPEDVKDAEAVLRFFGKRIRIKRHEWGFIILTPYDSDDESLLYHGSEVTINDAAFPSLEIGEAVKLKEILTN